MLKMNVVAVPYIPSREMYFDTEEKYSGRGTKRFRNSKTSSQVSDRIKYAL